MEVFVEVDKTFVDQRDQFHSWRVELVRYLLRDQDGHDLDYCTIDGPVFSLTVFSLLENSSLHLMMRALDVFVLCLLEGDQNEGSWYYEYFFDLVDECAETEELSCCYCYVIHCSKIKVQHYGTEEDATQSGKIER